MGRVQAFNSSYGAKMNTAPKLEAAIAVRIAPKRNAVGEERVTPRMASVLAMAQALEDSVPTKTQVKLADQHRPLAQSMTIFKVVVRHL